MACLGALPAELLRLIADFVSEDASNFVDEEGEIECTPLEMNLSTIPWEGAFNDLAALALTNRFFNQVFEPLLYQWDTNRVDGLHAVFWAIRSQSLGTLKKAQASGLDFGSVLSWSLRWGRPLERAISYSDDEPTFAVLKWLLENGAKPTPSCLAREMKHADVRYPASYQSRSVLYQAIEMRNERAALLLLDHGATIFLEEPRKHPHEGIKRNTAVHEAARKGCVKVLERLLRDGPVGFDCLDSYEQTPLICAGASGSHYPNGKVIKLLLQHGANPLLRSDGSRCALEMALLQDDRPRDLFYLLRHTIQDASNTPPFSHASLWTMLSVPNWRLKSTPPGGKPNDYPAKNLSVFVKLGADFNNPPPPYASAARSLQSGRPEPLLAMFGRHSKNAIVKALLDIGAADPLTKMDQGRTVFDVFWTEYLERHSWDREVVMTAFLRAGARVDVKDPVTGETALESAAAACDRGYEPQCRMLQFLLQQVTVCRLASNHIYDILDSHLACMKEHLHSCILIMQHGWVSSNAQAYVFDWLLSYLVGSPNRDGIYLDLNDSDFNAKAARFFPMFLDRKQLAEVWARGVAGLKVKRGKAVWARSDLEQKRWRTLPWWDICAMSGSAKDIEVLWATDLVARIGGHDRDHDDPDNDDYDPDDYDDEEDRRLRTMKVNEGAQTPIMRAVSAGNADVVQSLIEKDNWIDSTGPNTFKCKHRMIRWDDTCTVCSHGQRSAYEIAMLRGDVDLLELMWEYQTRERCWDIWLEDMPRVLSYGNVMVEWIHVNLCLNTMRSLQMSGEDAVLRIEAERKLSQLRTEITKTQVAWTDRAKSLGREAPAPKSLPLPMSVSGQTLF